MSHVNDVNPRHPHQCGGRDEEPVLDAEGRCLVCSRDLLDDVRVRLPLVEGERDRYHDALLALDALDPNDFKVGQGHLTAAFREPNLKAAIGAVIRIVNRALHNADEYGRPLPEES